MYTTHQARLDGCTTALSRCQTSLRFLQKGKRVEKKVTLTPYSLRHTVNSNSIRQHAAYGIRHTAYRQVCAGEEDASELQRYGYAFTARMDYYLG